MILKDILFVFHKELDEYYGNEEVNSFFNLLMQHHLNLNRFYLVLNPQYMISIEKKRFFFEALKQLKLHKPIQYIIGKTEFFGLPFEVNEHTLIPRPETEELVSWIIDNQSKTTEKKQLKILDIGAGSGCITVTLAKHLINSKVTALDVSKAALSMVKQNADLNDITVDCIHDTILNPSDFLCNTSLKYDIIVSNPPYVRHLEKAEIQPNVLEYEPHLALFVDDHNPLQFYKSICEFSKINLVDGGVLYFEINEYLGNEMIALMTAFNFKSIELKKDMFGKDRMIKGVK